MAPFYASAECWLSASFTREKRLPIRLRRRNKITSECTILHLTTTIPLKFSLSPDLSGHAVKQNHMRKPVSFTGLSRTGPPVKNFIGACHILDRQTKAIFWPPRMSNSLRINIAEKATASVTVAVASLSTWQFFKQMPVLPLKNPGICGLYLQCGGGTTRLKTR